MKTLQERFEEKYEKGDGCWNWKIGKNRRYGKFRVNGRHQQAHRVSYQLYVGEIPNGMQVLHRCDNTICVRPDHLFLGTQKDNIQDCVHKGRIAHGEKSGRSKLTEEQVRTIRIKRIDGGLQVNIAKEFGVTQGSISAIDRRISWAWMA